jgi:hypothetical protein
LNLKEVLQKDMFEVKLWCSTYIVFKSNREFVECDNHIVIDKDIFNTKRDVILPFSIIEKGNGIYDETIFDRITNYLLSPVTGVGIPLTGAVLTLSRYVAKLESKYNELASVLQKDNIEHFRYDLLQNAKLFTLQSNRDRLLLYDILSACIAKGLNLRYNRANTLPSKTIEANEYEKKRNTDTNLKRNYQKHKKIFALNDTFRKQYHGTKKEKWTLKTGVIDTPDTTAMKERMKHWRMDTKFSSK